jgi:hypothetical protein
MGSRAWIVEPVASAVVGVPGTQRRAVSGTHTHTRFHRTHALPHAHMHACTRCALGLALRRRRVAWRLVTRLRCRCAVTAVIVTTSPTAAPASHHAPRNYDLRRWRFLCRDWQLALPARRRGYRWVVALLTLRFQTSASTLPPLWPSTYSSRGWVSARLWLRLGLNLAPTCPNLPQPASTCLNLAVARKPHRPVTLLLLRPALFPFCAHVPCPRNPNTSADASVAQHLLFLRSLHSPSPAVLHPPIQKSADAYAV